MTPLPKRRHSSARQSKRTRALKPSDVTLTACMQCGALKKPHSICMACGYYKGKQVIVISNKSARRSQAA